MESKNLLQMLNELQGKSCFVKEMTATNVWADDGCRNARPCQLSLPKLFAEENRMKISSNDVVFHTRLLDRTWSLRLAHYPSRGEFSFTCGWKRFVADNDVQKGDILVFSLSAISEFVVYIFDSQGLPRPPPKLPATNRIATELKVSKRIQRVLEVLGNKREEKEKKSRVTRSKARAHSDDESADLPRQSNARSTKLVKTMEFSPAKTSEEKLVKEADHEAPSVMPLIRKNNRVEVTGRNMKRKIRAPPKAES